jgi:WD40 repeat protein
MRVLASRNASAIVRQFEGNANVTWTGRASGLTGLYVGADTIGLLLNASFLSRSTSFAIANATQEILAVSDRSATVNSSFDFTGQSPIYGNFNGTVRAQDSLVYSATSGGWLISQEIWNFTTFNAQYLLRGYSCSGPSCPAFVQAMAISADGNFLAAGAYQNSGYGSVYLVSLQKQAQGVLWRSPTDTTIWTVAISSNGSYVAAGGFVPGDPHGHGEVYLFNKEGRLLWNVSAGSKPRMVGVAIAANGSRVSADYGNGIIYLDTKGEVLWNRTFPQGGASSNFAMSSDAKFIAYTDENVTMQSSASLGWGVFYLDSQGRQLWSYSEAHVGIAFVTMSSDGSHVVASSRLVYNGSVFYFDGRSGAIMWQYPFFPENGIADYMSLAMSADGSYLASGGPASGVLGFDSSGKVLWEGRVGGFGEPAFVLETGSFVLMYGPNGNEVQLLRYNGTLAAPYGFESLSALAGSPNGSVWVAAGGQITKAGGCATLHLFDGPTAIPSMSLC